MDMRLPRGVMANVTVGCASSAPNSKGFLPIDSKRGRGAVLFDEPAPATTARDDQQEGIRRRRSPTRAILSGQVCKFVGAGQCHGRDPSQVGSRQPASLTDHRSPWLMTRRSATMRLMAAPPASTKTSLQQRLSEHARTHWPQLAGVTVRFRGAFAYVDGQLPDGETLPLMRLRYGGSATRWGFAMYLFSKEGCEDAVLPAGAFAGLPEDALDCAAGLYLSDPKP